MAKILVVDDEESVCWALSKVLTRLGHHVEIASNADDGLKLARSVRPDLVLLDVRMPGRDGLSILPEMTGSGSGRTPVIIMTAFGDLDTAVKAMEGQASDYLIKPFDLDKAIDSIGRALASKERGPEHQANGHGPDLSKTRELVGSSAPMQEVFRKVALVAPSESPVLLGGESGTGKEMVARAIHRHSPRRDGPFLPVNASALDVMGSEIELFGSGEPEGGRPGLFGLARGGTLFIDDICDLPLRFQAALLRVLEQGEYLPVNNARPVPCGFRIMAATSHDPARMAAEGAFLPGLLTRLGVFRIGLAPLRQRLSDIVPLAEHFLSRLDGRCLPICKETKQALESHSWPGNVRELRSAVEHAVILARGNPILPVHLPLHQRETGVDSSEQLRLAIHLWLDEQDPKAVLKGEIRGDLYDRFLASVEGPLLEELLRRTQNNRLLAAQILGLNRATLRKKMIQYGLGDPGETQ